MARECKSEEWRLEERENARSITHPAKSKEGAGIDSTFIIERRERECSLSMTGRCIFYCFRNGRKKQSVNLLKKK